MSDETTLTDAELAAIRGRCELVVNDDLSGTIKMQYRDYAALFSHIATALHARAAAERETANVERERDRWRVTMAEIHRALDNARMNGEMAISTTWMQIAVEEAKRLGATVIADRERLAAECDEARLALRSLVDATNWQDGAGIVVAEGAMNDAMALIMRWFDA